MNPQPRKESGDSRTNMEYAVAEYLKSCSRIGDSVKKIEVLTNRDGSFSNLTVYFRNPTPKKK